MEEITAEKIIEILRDNITVPTNGNVSIEDDIITITVTEMNGFKITKQFTTVMLENIVLGWEHVFKEFALEVQYKFDRKTK